MRTPPAPGPVEMRPVVATAMGPELKAIGLDVTDLAPLERLEPAKLRKVMQTFTRSLGVRCPDCHLDDFAAPTPKKKIAARMWNELVRGLSLADGTPLYCDSCHQGRTVLLDRRDKKRLATWMSATFIDNLARKDGGENGCATCHGERFDPTFLQAWARPN